MAAPARADGETGRPYLKRPARTPEAIARQVAGDRQLLARYSKHFQAPASSVLGALRAARPVSLPPGRYTVWLTGRDGLRYPTEQERSGVTPAFLIALPHGQDSTAWLEAGTGSPMEPFRPVEQIEIVVENQPEPVQEVQTPREVLVPVGQAAVTASAIPTTASTPPAVSAATGVSAAAAAAAPTASTAATDGAALKPDPSRPSAASAGSVASRSKTAPG